MKEIKITSEYIKLGQFLKFATIIDSGAQAKQFLEEYDIYVNGEIEKRRGRKLYNNDIIEFNKIRYVIKLDE